MCPGFGGRSRATDRSFPHKFYDAWMTSHLKLLSLFLNLRRLKVSKYLNLQALHWRTNKFTTLWTMHVKRLRAVIKPWHATKKVFQLLSWFLHRNRKDITLTVNLCCKFAYSRCPFFAAARHKTSFRSLLKTSNMKNHKNFILVKRARRGKFFRSSGQNRHNNVTIVHKNE